MVDIMKYNIIKDNEMLYSVIKSKCPSNFQAKKSLMTTINPSDFLKLASERGSYDNESLEWIERNIVENKPISIPYIMIDFNEIFIGNRLFGKVNGHEGRHRAFICDKLGIKEFPVYFEFGGFEFHNLYPLNNGIDYNLVRQIEKPKENWYEYIGKIQTSESIQLPNYIDRIDENHIKIYLLSQSLEKLGEIEIINAKINDFKLNFIS